ncbi:MAG: flagellin FliC [Bacteriovoracaceae bacterium]|nr:flagellin FliC [Bacteriovoracaceae bacterium]
MGIRINTNVASLAAQRNLGITNNALKDNFAKLSSGSRITKASDDAAGLAISEKLRAQIRGIRQAKRNAEDGISLIQTAEGGLQEISNIVIRLRELAIQAASDTVGNTERSFTDVEFQSLKDEVQRIAMVSEFNGRKLLNGTGGLVEVQVGIYNDAFQDRLKFDSSAIDATLEALGIAAEGISTKEGAQISLQALDDALVKINGNRAELGALQNRLGSIVNTQGINDENLSAANSRIRDVDVATETADLTKNSILNRAGVSVLTQANASPEAALKLIG